MNKPLESLTKEELIALGQSAFEQISLLESNVNSLESNVNSLESKLSQKDYDIACMSSKESVLFLRECFLFQI